jgi:phosphoserine phosphatase
VKTTFFFDLDGTLTRQELLPLIGKEVGIYEELEELTRRTMQGEIPFDQSFRYRVDLLASVPLYLIQDIVLNAPCFEQIIDWIKQHQEKCYVVTGNLDIWIDPWLEFHQLKGFSSSSTMINGKVSVNHILKKETVLSKFQDSKTVMIGEGANDSRIMELSDVGIATELTHKISPILWEHSNYVVRDEVTLCRLLTQLL